MATPSRGPMARRRAKAKATANAAPVESLAPIRRERRSLAHVGGKVSVEGDPAITDKLALALDVAPAAAREERAEAEARAHVHGFHPYPARMHPKTAGLLLEAFLTAPGTLLDPFCGSGTVLVEGRARGHSVWGFDLNPIAVMLSTLKTHSFSAADRQRMTTLAEGVAAEATARRLAKSGPSRRYPAEDVAQFDPHVLLELDGLRVGVEALSRDQLAPVMRLLLSSILTKLSKRDGDTGQKARVMRIAAGYPAKLYQNKTRELVGLLETSEALFQNTPAARMRLGDARELPGLPDRSVDLVVTSPPYPGVYDYVEHHRTRLRWLGADANPLERGEIGARRSMRSLDAGEAARSFEQEMFDLFTAFRRVLRPRGKVILLLADGAWNNRPIRVEEIVKRAAASSGLTLTARASQDRPHFHGGSQQAFSNATRREHALLVELAPTRTGR